MANERKVEIKIDIAGNFTTELEKLSGAFTAISNAVKSIENKVTALAPAFEKFKIPPGFTTAIESLKGLNGVKIPNVNNFATGLSKLAKISDFPNLDKFVDELKKFAKIRLPNVLQIANGFKILADASLDTIKVGARLRILQRNLKRFSDINIPNLGNIVNSLKPLQNLDLTGISSTLLDLANALKPFKKISLPGVSSMVTGFERLAKLNVDAVTAKIKELSTAIKLLERAGNLKSFAKFASDLRIISTVLTKTSINSRKAQDAIQNLGNSAEKSGRQVKGFGERLKNYLQYRLIADSLFVLKDAFFSGISAIIDFDQAMKDLEAIMQATPDEVAAMSAAVKQVASDTKFSATEVAEGMRILGQAGLSAAEATQSIEAVANLATGTLTDMALTVDLVTTALRVFSIDASQSAHVADVFANAVNGSKLTIDKLKTSMNYVGPIAKSAGLSIEETAASMMTLANSGLRASTIGTGLRRMLAELVSPSKKMAAAAAAVGVSLDDLDPTLNSTSDVLSSLGIVLQDTSVAFDIFGKRGAAAALAMTNDVANGFDRMLASSNRFGTAAKMAATQMEGLGVAFKNLADKTKLIAVALGEAGLTSILKFIVDGLRNLADATVFLVNNAIAPLTGA